MKKKYTHIFFDLDNTLWDFKTNSLHALQATFNFFGLNTQAIKFEDFFDVYARHNHQLWKAYRNKQVRKKELTNQRFQLTFNEFGLSGMDADAMNSHYLSEMPKQNHLIDGAIDLLDYLKSKKYKLFIITNGFKEVQHKKLVNSGLQRYFDKVFISEEVKAPKPDPVIFEHAIKSGNAKKASSLMIGDDYDVDIKGALNFGIDAVFFSPEKDICRQKKETFQNNKVISVSDLREIRSFID